MGNWIAGMHMQKGALHRDLHVPAGQKIPQEEMREAASRGGTVGRRARLAMTLSKMHHGKRGSMGVGEARRRSKK